MIAKALPALKFVSMKIPVMYMPYTPPEQQEAQPAPVMFTSKDPWMGWLHGVRSRGLSTLMQMIFSGQGLI